MFCISATTCTVNQDSYLPLSAVFFEVDRYPPKRNPVAECQLRDLTVALPLLVALADDLKAELSANLVHRVLLRCRGVRNIL